MPIEEFKLKPTELFLSQLEELNLKNNEIDKLNYKLDLLKINPKRNKSLFLEKYNLLRIRFTTTSKELRIVYTIERPFVKILFILDRSKNYKDLEKYLKKVEEEF